MSWSDAGLIHSPPPLGVYIHWPYCSRICPYCDFNVVRDRGPTQEQAALVEAIVADLEAHAALTGPRRLVSIFFGGGTPSLLDPVAVHRLISKARSLWTAEPNLEITLEANPTDAEVLRFSALAKAGIDRLSLGLQSLDDASLAFLGRNHDAASGLNAARMAARIFGRLSLDLIYALPGQTERDWAASLRVCADLAEHVSAYQLTIEAGTPFDRAVRRGRFQPADPDLAAALYETTEETLTKCGFDAYEVSNHARGPGARSRHNLLYWRGEDWIGVGPGAHGRLSLGRGRLASEAERNIQAYVRRVEHTGLGWTEADTLDERVVAEERLMMGLRIDEGVPLSELRALDLSQADDLVQAGYLRRDAGRLVATRTGRQVLDSVLRGLLAGASSAFRPQADRLITTK